MPESVVRSGMSSVFTTALLPSTMLEGAAVGGLGPHLSTVKA